MNKNTNISFFIPIEPQILAPSSTTEWVRSQADQLLSYGHHFYRLDKDNNLTLAERPLPQARSYWEITKQIVLLALFAIPAAFIKVLDRFWFHKYSLAVQAGKNVPLPNNGPQAGLNTTASSTSTTTTSTTTTGATPSISTPTAPTSAAAVSISDQKPSLAANKDDVHVPNASEKGRSEAAPQSSQTTTVQAPAIAELTPEQKTQFACHLLADNLLKDMIAMFYDSNGQIKNELAMANIGYHKWGDNFGTEDRYKLPETLRDDAETEELLENNERAQELRAQADANQTVLDDYINNRMQKTLFPIANTGYGRCELKDLLEVCEKDFSNTQFFHTTLQQQPQSNKPNPVSFILNAGFGTYLAFNEEKVKAVCENAHGNGKIFNLAVNPKGKIATYKEKWKGVLSQFSEMVRLFVKRNESKILEALTSESGNEYTKCSMVEKSLVNFFNRDFYIRHGFRGVYGSPEETTNPFLILFYPEEDIVSIK
jgi:hypothetical protein